MHKWRFVRLGMLLLFTWLIEWNRQFVLSPFLMTVVYLLQLVRIIELILRLLSLTWEAHLFIQFLLQLK